MTSITPSHLPNPAVLKDISCSFFYLDDIFDHSFVWYKVKNSKLNEFAPLNH